MDDNWGYPYDFGNIQIGIDWEGPQIYAMFKREKKLYSPAALRHVDLS